jgi:hypothetical protein
LALFQLVDEHRGVLLMVFEDFEAGREQVLQFRILARRMRSLSASAASSIVMAAQYAEEAGDVDGFRRGVSLARRPAPGTPPLLGS